MITRNNLNIRDPFVYVEDNCYYLYSSSNKHLAFLCFKSTDLENFEEPKEIFRFFDGFWGTQDYWAPEVHKHNSKYYLFATLKGNGIHRGTQIFVSDTPDGEFKPLTERAITPLDWECLDGTLYVDNGTPYLVFCREWTEIKDGEMYAVELTDDLVKAVNKPIKLFAASDAKWTSPFSGEDCFVTDGPFIIRKDDHLEMIWSSFSKTGYAVGICTSPSIYGPWHHLEKPIYENNGGHAMVFSKDGKKYMALHSPNSPNGHERPVFMPYPSN